MRWVDEEEDEEDVPAGCACCLTALVLPFFLFVLIPLFVLLFG